MHRHSCLWRPVQGNRRCIKRTGQAEGGFRYNSSFLSLSLLPSCWQVQLGSQRAGTCFICLIGNKAKLVFLKVNTSSNRIWNNSSEGF
jgi:hypothetical protein